MKLQGFVGKGSGKMGASVWVIRKGQQIVREYNKNILNPKSDGQVHQRAKFKLMSQVAALLAPVVANRPVGGESIRNAFTRENAAAFTWDANDSRAVVDMLGLSITSSAIGLPNIISLTAASPLAVGLRNAPLQGVDAVFYAAFGKIGDKYEYAGSVLVDTPGANYHYDGTIPYLGNTVAGVLYAYGVKWMSEDIRTIYESYKADPAHSASLVLQLVKNPAAATLTMTRAAEIAVGA